MQPSRRSVLLAGAVGLAAGCHVHDPAPAVDPDLRARADALATETELLAAYRAVVTSVPALRPLVADHEARVAALSTPVPTPAPSAVRTIAQLVAMERAAATAHGRAAVTATRAFAPLLASLSAASASSAEVL